MKTWAWTVGAEDELFVIRAIESAVATIQRRQGLPEDQRKGWYEAFGREPGQLTIRVEVMR